jgi:hypothetical protein
MRETAAWGRTVWKPGTATRRPPDLPAPVIKGEPSLPGAGEDWLNRRPDAGGGLLKKGRGGTGINTD